LYLKYILSILILVSTLFSYNIEVVESFGDDNNAVAVNKPSEIIETKTVIVEKNSSIPKIKTTKKTVTTLKKYKKLSKKPIEKIKLKSKNKSIINSKNKRAKLAIIIDDVSHKFQLKEIKSLPFKVTPSIFPPTKMNMYSYKLAIGLKHFMVHLPLESHSKQMNKIYKLIRVTDSKKKMEKRIEEIRKLFPNAKYINNHTGSKFTANYNASKKLYKILIKNGFIFVDSRTTYKTKIPKIAKEFNRRYLKSDLFMDNKIEVNAILHEIKTAIALAKRRGYAVIIGHPHPQTIQALKKAAKYLKQVKTVYIDEL